MSAFICSDRHIATVATNYAQLIGQPEEAQTVADKLLADNIVSVNYRYKEDTPVEPCSLEEVEPDASFEDLVALCVCLDYQSCEPPGYDGQFIAQIKGQFAKNCRAGVKSKLWSI